MQQTLPRSRLHTWATLTGCLLFTLAAVPRVAAQGTPPLSTTLAYPVDSGPAVNTGNNPRVVISFPVHVQGAKWMRLRFEHVQLSGNLFAGNGATLRMTSTWDAEVQEMSAVNVRQWQESSAYFNGDTVLVEVLAQPGTGINHLILDSVTVDLVAGAPESICGTDDRVSSSDPRVSRLVPIKCTAFLIDNCVGCYLTAADCADSQTVAQFNVPPSDGSGSITHPPVQDQYAVDPASIQNSQGLFFESNYGYFGTFPNPNTGLTARQAQGAGFTLDLSPFGPPIRARVTGYGADTTPPTSNRTQQTDASGGHANFCNVYHSADTSAGSAGSPVIDEATGLVVSIQRNDGCMGGLLNNGSLLSCGPLTFLQNPLGVCRVNPSAPQGMPTILVPNLSTPVVVALHGPILLGSAQLHYRLQSGPFLSQPLTNIGAGLYQGILPPASGSDSPEWYFSVENPGCGILTLPANAPTSGTFSATVTNVVTTYCTAKSGLSCGTPAISVFGTPSASAANGFVILAGPAQQNRMGLILYTDAGSNIQTFQGGTLCVSTPLYRGPAVNSAGSFLCDGEFLFDMNAFAAGLAGGNPAGFLSVPDNVINVQWWGRDTTATGRFLSDAIQYTVSP